MALRIGSHLHTAKITFLYVNAIDPLIDNINIGGSRLLEAANKVDSPVKASRSHPILPGGYSALLLPKDQLTESQERTMRSILVGDLFIRTTPYTDLALIDVDPTDEGGSTALRLLEHTEVES